MHDDYSRRPQGGHSGSQGGYRGGHRGDDRGGYRGGPGGGHGHGGHGGHGGGGPRGGDERGGRRGGLPLSELDPALTEISRRVIGCAIEVHKELGPGYTGAMYRRALMLELGDEQIPHRADAPFKIYYGDDEIGEVMTDLFIADRFLVKVMAESREVGGQERSELRAQLRAADLELGLIINFGERRLKDGLVRVLNPDKLNAMRGEAAAVTEDAEGDEEFEDEGEEESAT